MTRVSQAAAKFAMQFLLVCAFFLVGQTLLRATFQSSMDCCIGFWGVVGEVFRIENWSFDWAGEILIVGAAITMLNRFTPRPAGTVPIVFLGAFAGAYYHAVFTSDLAGGFDHALSKFLDSHLPTQVAVALGLLIAVPVWTFPMILLLMLKLAGRWMDLHRTRVRVLAH